MSGNPKLPKESENYVTRPVCKLQQNFKISTEILAYMIAKKMIAVIYAGTKIQTENEL